MGSSQSQEGHLSVSGAPPRDSAAKGLELGKEFPIPRQASDSELDLQHKRPQQQLQHKQLLRRTSSQRGYNPRSASLRRMRSIQRRRILEGSNAKTGVKPPAKRTAKMEAENKKMQEEKALLAACARGDLSKVEKLVDSGVDVNAADQNQMTALHYAAMHARDEVIRSLISRGAEVNTADIKGGFTAVHWAVINSVPKYGSNHLEVSLTTLAKAGCRVNGTDFNFATPLHIAAQKGSKEGAKTLIKLGADPDKVDITGRNCFDVAKTEQMRTFMRSIVDGGSSDDERPPPRHIYHVLEAPPPSTRAPLPPVSPPPSITSTPLPPVPPPRLIYTRKNSSEHIYHTPEFHSPPGSPSALRPISITPPPPPPRRQRQFHQQTEASRIYHVLEPVSPRHSRIKRTPSPPRRRKARKHL